MRSGSIRRDQTNESRPLRSVVMENATKTAIAATSASATFEN